MSFTRLLLNTKAHRKGEDLLGRLVQHARLTHPRTLDDGQNAGVYGIVSGSDVLHLLDESSEVSRDRVFGFEGQGPGLFGFNSSFPRWAGRGGRMQLG